MLAIKICKIQICEYGSVPGVCRCLAKTLGHVRAERLGMGQRFDVWFEAETASKEFRLIVGLQANMLVFNGLQHSELLSA